jgi:hypothetical protein
MDLKAKLEKGIELKSAGNKAFSSNDIKGGMNSYFFLLLNVSIHVTVSVCSSYELSPGTCRLLPPYVYEYVSSHVQQALLYLLGTDNIQEAMGSQTIKEDPVKLEIKQQTAACYSNLAGKLRTIRDTKSDAPLKSFWKHV